MYAKLIKYIISILLIYFSSMMINWWVFCIITFIIGLLSNSLKEAFLAGSFCPTIIWVTILTHNYFNDGAILISKISLIFGLPNPLSLLLLSITIPFVLGSITSITGFQFRRIHD